MSPSQACTAFLLVLALLILPVTAGATLPENETHLWELAAAEQSDYEQRCTLLDSPDLTDHLGAILSRLWRQADTDLPPMTLKVIQEPAPNAFTYPNGVCYITTGMLVRLRNEDQLAMVLAHEMIHYIRRHTLGAVGFLHGDPADTGQEPGTDSAGYRRQAEIQADREGLALMQESGFNTMNVITLLNGFPCDTDQDGHSPALAERFRSSKDRRRMARAIIDRDTRQAGNTNTCELDHDYRLQVLPALLADARASIRSGLWHQAEKDLADYMMAFPDNPEAYFLQGELRRRLSPGGRNQEAIHAYRQAIRLDQGFAPAYRELGVVHFKLGDRNTARQFFETYLSLAPQAEGSEYIRGYLNLCTD